jgi:hypothetical protein
VSDSRRVAALLIGALSLCLPCSAQCLEWHAEIGNAGLSPGKRGGEITALAAYDDGAGTRLYAGGGFELFGNDIGVVRWDGASWTSIGDFGGVTFGPPTGPVCALSVFDTGTHSVLVAAGFFGIANGLPARNIASWDGTAWSALGSGLDSRVNALCTFDDGTGPELYAAGYFAHAGGIPANGIAKWDGSSWSALGSGVLPGNSIHALGVFDDGGGPALYAAGNFEQISGVTASRIARFDGTSWSSVGAGVNGGWIHSLAVYDDGTGRALFAGGSFTSAGGAPASAVAKWDGSTWSAIGAGLQNGGAATLTVWNDGTGPKLFVGGTFAKAGALSVNNVALWDGTEWSAMRGGVRHGLYVGFGPRAQASLVFDTGLGIGSELIVGGEFGYADGISSQLIASYGRCEPVGQPYCFGDGSLPTPCPCTAPNVVPNPTGGSDAGCANSFIASGGKLVASGTTSPDSVRLLASDVSPGFAIFIGGDGSESAGVASGDGVRCAGGTFFRFGGQNAIIATARYPRELAGWTTPLAQMSGVSPGSGAVRHYQLMYRNPLLSYCNSSTFNWTNAVTLIW